MNKTLRSFLDVLWYIIAFALIQFAVQMASAGIYAGVKELEFTEVLQAMSGGRNSELLVVSSVMGSLITLIVFKTCRWTVMSRSYLASRPFGVLVWVALLSLGVILPAEWIYERLQVNMPESTQALFEGVMKEPLGYLAVGILAPIVEEMVFRGAVLRSLLSVFDRRWHWVAIVFSALLFGVVHLNVAQGLHAFVIGLLLGWMYYRTSSIIPGILLHWINNTVAYLMFHLMPHMSDGKLIDLFHGDEMLMYKGLGCSLLIVIPSLYQLAVRMRK